MEILASRVIIRPRDLERSLGFYEDTLGLAIHREFGSGNARGVSFFAGGGFIEVSGGGPEQAGDAVQVWLQVRDVDAVHERLRARGVTIVEAPVDEPWGLREMRVRDPDGILLIFVEVPADHPLRRDSRPG